MGIFGNDAARRDEAQRKRAREEQEKHDKEMKELRKKREEDRKIQEKRDHAARMAQIKHGSIFILKDKPPKRW